RSWNRRVSIRLRSMQDWNTAVCGDSAPAIEGRNTRGPISLDWIPFSGSRNSRFTTLTTSSHRPASTRLLMGRCRSTSFWRYLNSGRGGGRGGSMSRRGRTDRPLSGRLADRTRSRRVRGDVVIETRHAGVEVAGVRELIAEALQELDALAVDSRDVDVGCGEKEVRLVSAERLFGAAEDIELSSLDVNLDDIGSG